MCYQASFKSGACCLSNKLKLAESFTAVHTDHRLIALLPENRGQRDIVDLSLAGEERSAVLTLSLKKIITFDRNELETSFFFYMLRNVSRAT